MLAEKRLTELGFTLDEARNFINVNINQPQIIFDAANQYGVTTRMLGELSGYPRDVVKEYFLNAGYSDKNISTELDVSLLVNSDLSSLESFVSFNEREGALSTASLRALVKPKIDVSYIYDDSFTPLDSSQTADGVYSSGELGVENLDNVPATMSSLESLFYGSLINIFLALDQTELDQIKTFPANDDPEEFQVLILDALSESPTSIAWNDEQLADLVTDEAFNVLDKFWTADLLGVLDHSYLGLATA